MKPYIWLLAIVLCFAQSEANTDSEKAACAKVKERIRIIESKMRAGYTRAQGEKYEEQLRTLRGKRYKLCR